MREVRTLSPILRWGIPTLLMFFCLLCEVIVPDLKKPAFYSEGGPHEAIQALSMAIACACAIWLTCRVEGVWLRLWFGIAALCCLYVAGEEVSWGQHIFGWVTPEEWGQYNDQNETNLHNASPWLDQKPKILLQIGVLVGGLIIPALQRWKPTSLPPRFGPIYPTSQVVIAASFALAVKLIDTVQDIIGRHLFWRASEVLELFIYYFVMLYMVEMLQRFRRAGG